MEEFALIYAALPGHLLDRLEEIAQEEGLSLEEVMSRLLEVVFGPELPLPPGGAKPAPGSTNEHFEPPAPRSSS